MKSYRKNIKNDALKNTLHEEGARYFTSKNEEARLREAVYATDMEKFRLFTKMLRTNALFKRATVTHK
jgi:hypothetical protein